MSSRPEVKVLTRTQDFNVAASGDSAATTSDAAETNRWTALFMDPDEPNNARIYNVFRGTTQAAFNEYNESIFALVIPQGTEADQRVGSTINVLRDSWRFKFFWNLYNPENSTETCSISQRQHCPRQVKIRLVGVFQDRLLEPGDIGYTPTEMFEDIDSINSRFKRGDAQGYKVIYNKTKTLNLHNYYETNTNRMGSGREEVYFGCKHAYQRVYSITNSGTGEHGGTQDGNTTGVEIATDVLTTSPGTTVGSVTGGTAKGQILWYIFVEDNTVYPYGLTQDYWFYPQWGYRMQVKRRTYWNDP